MWHYGMLNTSDSLGLHNLTNVGAVPFHSGGPVTGEGYASFDPNLNQFLWTLSDASLTTGDEDKSILAWFRAIDVPGAFETDIIVKGGAINAELDLGVATAHLDDQAFLNITAGVGDVPTHTPSADVGSVWPANYNKWCMLVGTYTLADRTVRSWLYTETGILVGLTDTVPSNETLTHFVTDPLVIGGYSNTDEGATTPTGIFNPFHGDIGPNGAARAAWTADQRTALWNNGAGLPFSQWDSGDAGAGLTSSQFNFRS